jgi:hypothetical protein
MTIGPVDCALDWTILGIDECGSGRGQVHEIWNEQKLWSESVSAATSGVYDIGVYALWLPNKGLK